MPRLRVPKSTNPFFALSLVLFLNLSAIAQYSGGTGEPNAPYQIGAVADWIELINNSSDWDKNFILIADIDFQDVDLSPVGNLQSSFTGHFNGDGHSLNHITIKISGRSRGVGVFHHLGHNSQIHNLNIINITISGYEYVGCLAGSAAGSIISNCYVTGCVSGWNSVGGFIGRTTDSTIINCYSDTIVSGKDGIGGFIGTSVSNFITWCYSTGGITGNNTVGGFIGINFTGNLIHCYSDTTVEGFSRAGGLVGVNGAEVSGTSMQYGEITQCYSTGTIKCNSYAGGLIGYNINGSVTQCYCAGKIIEDSSEYGSDIGGMVGHIDRGAIINSYWDIETSGLTTSAAGIGKATNEMFDPNTFINSGWDFAGETQNGTNEIWQIPQGGGYPELTFFNDYEPQQLNGTGTQDDPYLISDANELGAICHYDLEANFKLFDSIDLSGITWGTAVIPYFEGNFDGNNQMISNMTIEGTGYTGLFGILFPKSEVKNLGITDVNITSLGEYTGGFVGYNRGTVKQCYVSGEMRNNNYIGGISGYSEGKISNCYTNVIVDSNNTAGGLLGCHTTFGYVNECYNTGKVTSNQGLAGGLIGTVAFIGIPSEPNNGQIRNCFWDKESSGQNSSEGGPGKTTAEMQTKSTFTNAGWDFVGETDNGTEDIWTICEGTNYPRFVWQIVAGDVVCPDGIDMDDFNYFMDHWKNTNCDQGNGFCEGTDLDFSGTVDINDFEILMNNWLENN